MVLRQATVFLISPVRHITKAEKKAIRKYIAGLEKEGYCVYWAFKDTDQNDDIGLRICGDNFHAMTEAEEIHIWWNGKSQGSIFDLGMAFALHEMFDVKIVLANREQIIPTSCKSFENVLLKIEK